MSRAFGSRLRVNLRDCRLGLPRLLHLLSPSENVQTPAPLAPRSHEPASKCNISHVFVGRLEINSCLRNSMLQSPRAWTMCHDD
jgi:hypothetical protein